MPDQLTSIVPIVHAARRLGEVGGAVELGHAVRSTCRAQVHRVERHLDANNSPDARVEYPLNGCECLHVGRCRVFGIALLVQHVCLGDGVNGSASPACLDLGLLRFCLPHAGAPALEKFLIRGATQYGGHRREWDAVADGGDVVPVPIYGHRVQFLIDQSYLLERAIALEGNLIILEHCKW